jgi:hypothetical protein
MKGLPKIALVLLFAFYFCVVFFIVFKLLTPYFENINLESVENNPKADFELLAFTKNNVQILKLSETENFKLQNPEYTFLVPEGKEKYFAELLNEKNKGMIFEIKVEPISENRQLISVSSDDIRSVVKNKYEATDKEVFPKTTTRENWRYTPFKLLACSLGGALTCLIFFVIYRKYFAR